MKLPLRNVVGGYRRYAPPPQIHDVSTGIWIHETPPGVASTCHRVLPDPEVSIAFACHRAVDGRPIDPALVLLGPVVIPRLFSVTAGYEMTAVQLRVECVKRLLDISPREHDGATEPLASVSPGAGAALFDRLTETRSPVEVAVILGSFVIAAAANQLPSPDDATRRALALIRRSRGRLRVDAIASALDLPERTLRRRVVDAADVSPKAYARTLRFLHAVERIDLTLAGPTPDWAQLALHAGYCDQSHMVREFHAFCAATPGDVRRERQSEPSMAPAAELVLLAERSNTGL